MKSNPTEIQKNMFDAPVAPDDNAADEIISVEKNSIYQVLTKNTTDVIFRLQLIPEHTISFVSPYCFNMTGYTPEEFYADNELLQRIVFPEDVNKYNRIKDTFDDIAKPVILRWLRKDGSVIWTEQTRTVIRDESGRVKTVYTIVRDITEHRNPAEQKKAEQVLQVSEDTFSKVFRFSPNPICIIDIENETFIDINDSYTRFTGYTREESIGRTSSELGLWVNEEDLKNMRSIIMQKGKLHNFQYSSRMKSGEIRTGLFSAVLINISGKLRMLLVTTDITEQKWAEDALKESEAFTSTLLTNTPYPTLVMYPDSSIKYVNPAFEKLTGFTLSEIIGVKFPYPWWPKENWDEIYACLKETHLGSDVSKEMAFQKKNGERFWIVLNATVINNNGQREYILINWVDITARKKMEMTIRESEEKFAKAFNTSPSIMSITTLDGEFLEVNEAFLRVSGLTREQVIGQNSRELNIWAYSGNRNIITEKIKKCGHFANEEIQFYDKNGELQTSLFSCEKINIGGKPCLISVSNDITKRKLMEKALRFSDAAFKSIRESIIAVDNKLVITYWNNVSEQLFGIKASQAIGRKLKDVIKPLDRYPGQALERMKILKTNGYNRNELLYVTPRGEVWVDTTIQVMKEREKRYGYVLTSLDITGRKHGEKTIRDSEEKFSKAFNSASDAMAIFSSNGGKFLEVNDNYVKLSGYSRQELIGHNADELNMWGSQEDRQRILRLSSEKGRFSNEETRFRNKSGEISICLFSAESINLGGERRMICVVRNITEHKQMELALRESEEKFSKAFSASANSICITSLPDNRLIEVNESFSRFTGYTREEVLGHTAAELGLWVYKEELENLHDKIEKDGGFHNLEMHSRTKSGEIKVGLASAEILNINGKPCRIVVITDITDRKQAEEALRESEEKFSKAFMASPGAIGITTVKDGRFIDVNDSFYHVLGYARHEVIGHTSKELNIFVDDPNREKLMEEVQGDGHSHNKIIKFRKKSGELGIGIFSAEKIIINNEPCIISINLEITQQIKAEESLRLLGSVTRQVTDSIVVTDPAFKITYMNKAAQNLFGYSIDEVMGTDIGLFDAAPISMKLRKDIQDCLKIGKTWTAEVNKRRKDGSTFLCDCRRSPLFDEDGYLSSYIVVYRDITEQKETEAKLQAQKLMVESILTAMPEGVLVTDSSDRIIMANESFRRIFRTGRKIIENKLLTEVLRISRFIDLYSSVKAGNTDTNSLEFRYKVKESEKVINSVIIKMDNERMLLVFSDVSREREEEDKLYLMDRLASLGEMAAGLAHELNNPLTGILTLSQLLVNSDLPEQHKEDLQCVYSEAKRAANIVKNVLLFTRNNSYENGKSSVNEVAKEILRLRQHEEKVKNINVVTNFEDNLPDIPLDKYQLQQVFLNIILNAEAAIEEAKRPGTLTITTEKINNHVNIMFTDTGCGIKKQDMSRIFDPFFTTKDIGKGTGLGLSICYGIIVKHNGKISVKSQVGKGTTFTIKMPIAA